MSRIAHVFVSVIFIFLGLTFLVSTGSIIQEFDADVWPTLLIAHSHNFLFFPILGILALAAFYVPSVVFTDLYWNHVKYGRIRFLVGSVVAILISLYFANGLSNARLRAIWEIAPKELAKDAAAPAPACTSPGDGCQRRPILPTLMELRAQGLHRFTLSTFARNCNIDPLLERPEADRALRHCFPAGAKLDTDACCRVQKQFQSAVFERWSSSATRSQAALVDQYLLPFKVFFVVVVVVIGCFLALWRKALNRHYPDRIPAIERGVVIGAIAMLFWPLMDYAYQQTSDVLFGRQSGGLPLRHSLVIVPWAVLLLLYFVERLGKDLERVAQISTIMASCVAILRYQEINDWSARLLGTGADWFHFIGLGVLSLVGLGLLVWPWRGTKHPFDLRKPEPRVPAGGGG